MATYVYRCSQDGTFDVRRTMGQAATAEACPTCGVAGERVFTSPHLGARDVRTTAAHDLAASSAEAPAVVGSPPARPVRAAPALHPATARLPRP